MLYPWIRPLLFKLSQKDPELAHEYALKALKLLGRSPRVLRALSRISSYEDPSLRQELLGLSFKNPVGLAAGFDKNARVLHELAALGFGFLEAGTVTRYPQQGNPRPRIFRFPQDKALLNRMGFNNEGADAISRRLQEMPPAPIPVGISIGKSKLTPLDKAVEDYLYSLQRLYPYGSYFAINVSSPNTPGLRTLQEKDQLEALVGALQRESQALSERTGTPRRPLLVKISPDLDWPAVDELLEVCLSRGVDGLIAVNTTLAREGLTVQINEAGGLSGKPLHKKALEMVRYIHNHAGLPVIGVGGIFNAQETFAMLKAGAKLVQIYTGLIYEGPGVVYRINQGLRQLMRKYGLRQIQEIAG